MRSAFTLFTKILNYGILYSLPPTPQAIEAGEEPDQDAGNESGKNQFNYSERAAQTFNNPMRERGVVTEPPPMLSFRNTVAQWEIYDSYMAEYSAQVRGDNDHETSGILYRADHESALDAEPSSRVPPTRG